ncbi:MAG: MgtC/SapB family protein, partial [Dehalococcoidia bacterium]|nr:MgtC/SapB family protein [Dehalococcoidia bacterium]
FVSLNGFGVFSDPSRVAAGVVTGIGFLGAGTILRGPGIIVGLTTAASIWAIAAVGVAVGAGLYLPGVATAVLVLIALRFPVTPRHGMG